jgi:hypothetical protein
VDGVIAREDPALFEALLTLARQARLVFFAGLPGTGKSLLIHQLAHVAHARGRRIHLLQWDVARPVFEASDAGRRYPLDNGVTHGVIRLAVGRWARGAVARWHADHPTMGDLLIGETPFIGHRLIDLAQSRGDDAEPVLRAPSTRFVIPVPSRALRQHLEAERARRSREPRHARERDDAPPDVLRALWRELFGVAVVLGVVADAPRPPGAPAYDPATYQRVYERLLVHRHAVALRLETRLPTADLSAHEFRIPTVDVVPSAADAGRVIRETEAGYSSAGVVDAEINGWYRVD